jgi:hypothetical protein
MRAYGVDEHYVREVRFAPGPATKRSGAETSGNFILVDYRRLGSPAEFGDGVQVWIDRKTEIRFVVPKSALRAADMIAVRAGHDLTRYSRIVERVHDLLYVDYRLRPPQGRRSDEDLIADGIFTLVVDLKTGRQVGKIIYGE